MSCNGCRILRKGCSENCILRQSLEGTDYSPQAQANATLFVAKFFGRARLMSFLSSVPQSQRPALFQSLLHEACGRTVNPVTGALGFLSTGNWHVCQSAVNTVLKGSSSMLQLQPLPGFSKLHNNINTNIDHESRRDLMIIDITGYNNNNNKRKVSLSDIDDDCDDDDGQTMLTLKAGARVMKRRHASPSDIDQSVMTTLESREILNTRHQFLLQRDDDDNYADDRWRDETKLLQLFF